MSAASASLGAKSNQTGAFRENVPGRFAALNVAVMAYAADLDGLSENPVWSRKSVVAGLRNCFNLLGNGQVIRAGYSTVFRRAQDSSQLPLNVDAQG